MLPDPAQLTGFYQTCFAMAVMTLAGRLVLVGRGGPAAQFFAGWGALCLALTLWGVLTPASLRIPATLFALAAAGGLLIRREGEWRGDLAQVGRMAVIASPLLLVMADIAPSQSDALAVMLPNSAYIHDYGHFPTQDGPLTFTDVPVAPYNTELVSLLGTLAGGGYTANGPSLFTILLHLAAGLLLAGVVAGERRPGWAETALGLALATLLNPGFVPRVSFSGYGESPLAIGLLFVGWLSLTAMGDLAAGRRPRLLALGLALAAMVNVKQQGIGLFAAWVGGALAVAASDPRIGWRRGGRAVLAAALPAAALYLAWRGYVLTRFPAGELTPLPLAQWGWGELPVILRDTVVVMVRKPVHFIGVVLVLALLAWRPRWLGDTARRAQVLAAAAAVLYNGYLLLTFVGHFKAEHSFHRYNTHLSLLVVLALVLAARDALVARPGLLAGNRRRVAGAVAVAVMLAAPLAARPLLRFDLDMPQPLLRQLARNLAAEIGPDDNVALILPGDNASVGDALDSLLRFEAPRRPTLGIGVFASAGPEIFARALRGRYRLALLSCTDAAPALGLPANAAALLAWSEAGGWGAVKVWPYPPVPKRTWWNWTGFIAGEPFCLKSTSR